jgi:peptide/nickel transport system substrate-binding protein
MREIIGDKRFRWALSLGINRDEINQLVYLGMAQPNQISPLPTAPMYSEEQAKNLIELDVPRANSLLDEMGLTEKNADGFRLRPDGTPITMNLEYAPVFGSWGDIAELLVGYWRELGIQAVSKEEDRTLFYSRKEANEHDLGFWTGSAEFNPFIDPRWFLPLSVESVHAVPYAQWYTSGGTAGEEPPGDLRTVQELYDACAATADLQEQVDLFKQIIDLNKENVWVIGACSAPPEVVIVKNNFRNVPEMAVSDWHLLTEANTNIEQYFIRQA